MPGPWLDRLARRPVFVVGPARSGTTVLVNALARHPRIAGGFGEAPIVARLGEVAAAHLEGPKVEYYLRSLRMPPEDLFRRLRGVAFEAALTGTERRSITSRLRRRAGLIGRRAWCAKTFPSEAAAAGLRAMFPGARFLFAIRNGCETVHSRTRFDAFAAEEFEEQCRTWAASVAKFEHLTRAPDAVVVRQEALATDPGATFSRILEFVGLPAAPACGEYCRTTLEHPLDEETQRGVDAGRRIAERAPAYESWTEEQKETFRALCADAMTRMEYPMPF